VVHDLDAVILGPSTLELRRARVCGLTLAERARRVAVKGGATRVVVDHAVPDGDGALVVVDASDHVVHSPLLVALGLSDGATRIAVDEHGAFAGAIVAAGALRAELAAAPARGPEALAALAEKWRTDGVPTVAHGDLARHPARTAAERKAAVQFLFRLVRKPQDTFLVRHFNRRVSYPFTRLLLPTPITPNMISVAVFLIGALGCVVLTQPGYWPPVIGTLIILFAGYIDGCDGEIARIRLESSKLGAWLDTLADEATTLLFVTCVGIHVYNTHHEPWLQWAIVVCAAQAVIAIYCVYYYLLATGGSGNSQDYPTSNLLLDVLRFFIRREAINLGSVIFAVAGAVEIMYAILALGGFITCVVLVPQHVQLRRSRPRAAPVQERAPS
jgi:phosphatidylglycerophosphate synthase